MLSCIHLWLINKAKCRAYWMLRNSDLHMRFIRKMQKKSKKQKKKSKCRISWQEMAFIIIKQAETSKILWDNLFYYPVKALTNKKHWSLKINNRNYTFNQMLKPGIFYLLNFWKLSTTKKYNLCILQSMSMAIPSNIMKNRRILRAPHR